TDYCAMLLGLLDAFDDQGRSGVTERGKNPAGVQPAHAQFSENVVPVEITRLELAGGGMAAVRDAHGAADAKTAFGEVEAVARVASDSIEFRPLDEFRIHAALQD